MTEPWRFILPDWEFTYERRQLSTLRHSPYYLRTISLRSIPIKMSLSPVVSSLNIALNIAIASFSLMGAAAIIYIAG